MIFRDANRLVSCCCWWTVGGGFTLQTEKGGSLAAWHPRNIPTPFCEPSPGALRASCLAVLSSALLCPLLCPLLSSRLQSESASERFLSARSTRSASDLACARSTLTHAQLHLLWLARPAPAQIIKLHWLAGSAAGAREGPNPTSTSPSTKTQRAVPTLPRSPPSPLPLSAAPFHHSTILPFLEHHHCRIIQISTSCAAHSISRPPH